MVARRSSLRPDSSDTYAEPVAIRREPGRPLVESCLEDRLGHSSAVEPHFQMSLPVSGEVWSKSSRVVA